MFLNHFTGFSAKFELLLRQQSFKNWYYIAVMIYVFGFNPVNTLLPNATNVQIIWIKDVHAKNWKLKTYCTKNSDHWTLSLQSYLWQNAEMAKGKDIISWSTVPAVKLLKKRTIYVKITEYTSTKTSCTILYRKSNYRTILYYRAISNSKTGNYDNCNNCKQ